TELRGSAGKAARAAQPVRLLWPGDGVQGRRPVVTGAPPDTPAGPQVDAGRNPRCQPRRSGAMAPRSGRKITYAVDRRGITALGRPLRAAGAATPNEQGRLGHRAVDM